MIEKTRALFNDTSLQNEIIAKMMQVIKNKGYRNGRKEEKGRESP